jgi:hypothetical protein
MFFYNLLSKNKGKIFTILLFLQIFFNFYISKLNSRFSVVPEIPNKKFIKINSFGDEELYFRILSTKLQNFGNFLGNYSSLNKDYDYKKLYEWMNFLDLVNHKSNLIPSFASYFFSHSSRKSNVKIIVKYLEEHASYDVRKKWWWIYQAMILSHHSLRDGKLSMRLAQKLQHLKGDDFPSWVSKAPQFILRDISDDCLSFLIMQDLLQNEDSSKENLDFFRAFFQKKLKDFGDRNFDPRSCYYK